MQFSKPLPNIIVSVSRKEILKKKKKKILQLQVTRSACESTSWHFATPSARQLASRKHGRQHVGVLCRRTDSAAQRCGRRSPGYANGFYSASHGAYRTSTENKEEEKGEVEKRGGGKRRSRTNEAEERERGDESQKEENGGYAGGIIGVSSLPKGHNGPSWRVAKRPLLGW